MNNIKFALSGLISFLCIGSILKFIIPQGSLKKTCEVLISVTVLASFLLSLNNVKLQNLPSPDFFSYEEPSLYDRADFYKQLFSEKTKKALEEAELPYKDVTVRGETDEDNYFVLKVIEITVNNNRNYQKEDYRKAVIKELGSAGEAVVIVEG